MGICSTCRRVLSAHNQSDTTRPLPKMPNYESIVLCKDTRAFDGTCDCYICLTARYKGHRNKIKGRGKVRQHCSVIDPSNGMYAASHMQAEPRKVNTSITKDLANRRCKKCMAIIGRGKNHCCDTGVGSTVRTNIEELIVNKLNQKQQERVVTGILKRKIESEKAIGHDITNVQFKLRTLGRDSRILVNPKEKKKGEFSTESLANYQTNTGASLNEMKKLSNFLRCSAGKKSVPAHITNYLSKKSKTLEANYMTGVFEFAIGKQKKNAKLCHSVINSPLFNDADDIYIIDKCVIHELHILQGFVNHLFWTCLVPLLGRERALLWPKNLNLIPKNYNGEIFEGNTCRKMLKEADKLNDRTICEKVGPLALVPFISSFKAMDRLVNSCFGKNAVCTDLKRDINTLKKMLTATETSLTLKIHVLIEHLEVGLRGLYGNGLGEWSEQAGESIHREFKSFWDRYKINNIDDCTYAERLKKAVVEFSSQHL